MSKQDTEYNGWSNYETWNVHLWLTNSEDSQQHWNTRARTARDIAATTKEPTDTATQEHGAAVYSLAKQLNHDFDQQVDDWTGGKPPCCFSDLLLASLREVNWREIAEALLEDVQAAT